MINADFKKKFEGSLSIGKQGEQKFQAFMKQNFPAVKLEDLSEDKQWQWKEVDWHAVFPDGREYFMEQKTDTWSSSPNLAIETWANYERKRKGWLYTSEANVLVYYFINGLDEGGDNLFFYDMEEVRKIVAKENLRTYSPPQERQVRGEGMKTTIGVRLPRKMIKPLASFYIQPGEQVQNHHSVRLLGKGK